MLALMRGVVLRGTAAQAFRDHPVIVTGKTGTSQGYRDAWFIAVTPHVAVGVWLGRDDDRSMGARSSGGRIAAPVAARILAEAHRAGLIDADGYRDGQRTTGIAWPPVPRPGAPRDTDPFWGYAAELPPAPAPVVPREPTRRATQNEGLRHDRWDQGGAPAMGGQVRPGAR
jgi:membrane peptidoglycan carboxypeptidase